MAFRLRWIKIIKLFKSIDNKSLFTINSMKKKEYIIIFYSEFYNILW